MNVAIDFNTLQAAAPPPSESEAGPAPKRAVAGFGFWVYLLSDIVLFSALFATYAVLSHETAGGPAGGLLFHQRGVALETACLLLSSYTCALMSMAAHSQRRTAFYLGAIVTFALGAVFLGLELNEFSDLIARGSTPQSSAFLSAFFTLVGCHGLHVAVGLVWLAVMGVQVALRGFTGAVDRRLLCFSLFWHALDIVWVAVFTFVYLMGVRT